MNELVLVIKDGSYWHVAVMVDGTPHKIFTSYALYKAEGVASLARSAVNTLLVFESEKWAKRHA